MAVSASDVRQFLPHKKTPGGETAEGDSSAVPEAYQFFGWRNHHHLSVLLLKLSCQ